jgi:hypothetical protein
MRDYPSLNRQHSDGRGVSDVLGFVLTFSIVLVSVVGAATVGFDQLEEFQTSEQITNAERAFRLIEQNFDQIQQSQAETRRSEINLHQGSLRLVEPPPGNSEITVTVSGTGVSRTVPLNVLRYEIDDTRIAYESGAVFYSDRNRNDVLEDGPELFCRNRGSAPGRAIVSTVTVQANGSSQYGGGIIGITGERNESRLLFPRNRSGADSVDESTGVTVQIDSQFDEAWEQYFLDQASGWTNVTGSPNTYECTDSDGIEVYVRQTKLDVRFAR